MRVNHKKSTDDKGAQLKTPNHQKLAGYFTLALAFLFLGTETAFAGTTGTELQGAYDSINDLVGGYGGRIIVIGGMVASGIIGYMRQSVGIAGTGIGLSLLVANAPSIADGVVSATI